MGDNGGLGFLEHFLDNLNMLMVLCWVIFIDSKQTYSKQERLICFNVYNCYNSIFYIMDNRLKVRQPLKIVLPVLHSLNRELWVLSSRNTPFTTPRCHYRPGYSHNTLLVRQIAPPYTRGWCPSATVIPMWAGLRPCIHAPVVNTAMPLFLAMG